MGGVDSGSGRSHESSWLARPDLKTGSQIHNLLRGCANSRLTTQTAPPSVADRVTAWSLWFQPLQLPVSVAVSVSSGGRRRAAPPAVVFTSVQSESSHIFPSSMQMRLPLPASGGSGSQHPKAVCLRPSTHRLRRSVHVWRRP